MCYESNVNSPSERALSRLIQKWKWRGNKKLLADPQVSEIAVGISCPVVSEGVCSLSHVFLLFLVNVGIRVDNSVYESIECNSLSFLFLTSHLCFAFYTRLERNGFFGW